ncbi:uncharacterized protein PAC_08736 [Phialocephala subalpina]|uniref:Uncharacterized protein n=1 Tax=Phialocephala subalpina TaxID=576137 RepID=A0A1L7X1E8_9HELO|nr:uncharacterized protein PAC_08736 [Phialocephala subalpina]
MSIVQKSIAGSTHSCEHDTISITDTIAGVGATSNDLAPTDTSQPNVQHPIIRAFEEELNSSWVYQKSRGRRARARPFSIAGSAQLTQTWSLLSGISLSGISNLSVWALPIQKQDLINSDMYWPENGPKFGFEFEFKVSNRKGPRSISDGHLPQLPELVPMLEHFDEEEQARDESSEPPNHYPSTSPRCGKMKRLGCTKCFISRRFFDVLGEKGELWLATNQDDP